MTKASKQNQAAHPFKTVVAYCPVGLGEEILSKPLPNELFKIVQQPVETPALHYGDIVSVTSEANSDLPRVKEVVKHSGYRGVTIRLAQNAEREKIRAMFEHLGTCRTVDDNRFTIHAPASVWPIIARTIDQGGITVDPEWPAYSHFR